MKNNYRIRLCIKIFKPAIFAFATGFCLSREWFWLSILCFLLTLVYARKLFFFQKRTVKDMKRLIEAIRFSESNIRFSNFADKGLAPELIPDMEATVLVFNEKLRKNVAEQNFYDMLLNRIDFGLIVTDKSGRVTWINKAALDVFGKPQPKMLSDLENVSPGLPETLNKLIHKETKIIELVHDRKVYLMAATASFFISEGRELKLISLKNIQTVLEETESDAWKKLIRVLTHEIMNSLTPIISLSETFSSYNDENRELMESAMQAIHRRSRGLVDFVNNYRKLTLIPQPEIVTFSAAELMDDLRNLLSANGLFFTYEILHTDMLLSADRSLIEQTLINLIKNACESCERRESPEVQVSIGKNDSQRPMIKVSDNGEGILPEVLPQIFVPFFTTKTNGSGIGLSICRQIINLHGGSISVESTPEKGSCFTILL